MLGIPDDGDREQLREWSGAIVKGFDPILTPEEIARDLRRERRDRGTSRTSSSPGSARTPATISSPGMIAAEDEGDRLTEEELVEQLILLYVAGHETTVNLIGNGTLALMRHRDQLELLANRSDASTRRWPTSCCATTARCRCRAASRSSTTRSTGTPIEAGTLLMTCLGSANRDRAKWGDTADTLDLRRADASQHMSFGGGVHSCLGAHLARLEGREAISALVRRFPKFELATDQPEWNGRIVLRGSDAAPARRSTDLVAVRRRRRRVRAVDGPLRLAPPARRIMRCGGQLWSAAYAQCSNGL